MIEAQTACPAVNFLEARRVDLKPDAGSHIDVVRQSDGSYTGFQVANDAPYGVIQATPHFERQFAACIPHAEPAKAPLGLLPVANPPGAGSQLQVSEPVGANYFMAHIAGDGLTLYFDIFDAQHNLISEKTVEGPADEPFTSLALDDLNGDGKLDLIAAFGQGVWTFRGNGDGTFQAGARQALAAAQTFAVADLNGDGKPDIVLTAPQSPQLNAFLGNGDGTFRSTPLPFALPEACSDPLSMALADLNGDGKTDLVVSPCADASGTTLIALGNGDGTFQKPAGHQALSPGYPNGPAAMVAIGDVNGDGIPDIVTAGGTILFGDGKGGVASRADYAPNLAGTSFADVIPTGAGPVLLSDSVILGDFDGDGKIDILFGTGNSTFLSGSANYPTLSVLFGEGGGKFMGAPVSAVPLPESSFSYSGALPPPAYALGSADFDGDGISDVAFVTFALTSDNGGDVQLTTLRGKSDGEFGPGAAQTFAHPAAFLLRAAAAADFNRDGKPDMAVLLQDYPSGGEIQIFAGKGDGSFGAPTSTPVPGYNPLGLQAADLNGDGIPDLAVTNQGAIIVYLGKGDGTFQAPVTIAAGVDNPAIVFGDFNGDGKLDIAAAGLLAGRGAVSIFFGKGDGTFSSPISIALPAAALGFPGNIAAADFNGDGHLDLVVALGGGYLNAPQQTAILLGNGDGTFPALKLGDAMEGFAIADINGDGIPDLIGLVAPALGPPVEQGALSVRLGNGDGTFQPDDIVLGQAALFFVLSPLRGGVPDIVDLYSNGLLSLLNLSRNRATRVHGR